MHRCNGCKKDFSRKDVLIRHQNTVRCKSKDVQTKPQTSPTKKRRLDFDSLPEQETNDSSDIKTLQEHAILEESENDKNNEFLKNLLLG